MTETAHVQIQFSKFSATHVVLEFSPGIHVIYGEGGTGKSSFARMLAGRPTLAPVNFSIKNQSLPNKRQFVFQNPDLQIINPSLSDELVFNFESNGMPAESIRNRVKGITDHWPMFKDLKRHTQSLSGGEKEILNIETALSLNPALLVIDDGLSFLGKEKKSQLIDRLKAYGSESGLITILFTSDESDCEFGSSWELTLDSIRPATQSTNAIIQKKLTLRRGELAIHGQNVTLAAGSTRILDGVNFFANRIRCLGIIGDNGSGKTTIARALVGLVPLQAGQLTVSLENQPHPKIGYMDQFPERLLGAGSIREFSEKLRGHGKITESSRAEWINHLSGYQLLWENISDVAARSLPWTTLRWAIITLLCHCNYDILILDEPTFGMGTAQRVILHRILSEYLKQKHLILISHDTDFIRALSCIIFSLDNNEMVKSRNREVYHDRQ